MILPKDNLYLIAGPCVIENMEMLRRTAGELADLTSRLGIDFIFKSSFDKANRSSIHGFRGPGLKKGLTMLSKIKSEFGVKLLTDVHTPDQIQACAEIIDLVQIPAFLARQTDFYSTAGKLKIPLNVKKGQFMAPQEMKTAIEKYRESGGEEIGVTERGTFFGYGNLVVDFRSIDIIRAMGVKYTFDATHSVQLPAGKGERSGGQREFIPTLVRGQIAAGADGLFMETHPDVGKAQSDKDTQFPLEEMKNFLPRVHRLYRFVREND